MDSFSKANRYNNQSPAEHIILSITQKVVRGYVQRKVVPQREFDDVVMSVVEKFCTQKDKIENSFEGRSNQTTYYIAVINRMCCEVIRKESRSWYLIESLSPENTLQTGNYETEKKLILEQEVKRLENLLFMNNEKGKVIMFLKFYFDIPIKHDDVSIYAMDKTKDVCSLLLKGKPKTKEDIFTCLAEIVNMVEDKCIGKDAVRIWFTNQLNSLINRLNGNDNAYHNKESLAIMLDMLYKTGNHRSQTTKPCYL